MSSSHQALTDIISKIQLLHDHLTGIFRFSCCLASVVVVIGVLWRFHVVSSRLAVQLYISSSETSTKRRGMRYYNTSKKSLKRFVIVIILLQLWNIIMSIGAPRILISLQRVKENVPDLPPELFTFSMATPPLVSSPQGRLFLRKDIKLFVVIAISLVLYKLFLNASHHVVQLIVDVAKCRHIPLHNDEDNEDERLELELWESNKVVSFNDNITIVEYSSSIISSKVTPTCCCPTSITILKQWLRLIRFKKALRHYVVPFLGLVVVLPLIYKSPMILLTTSSTIYIHGPEYQIRFDHVFLATIMVSLFNNFKSLSFMAPQFPTMTLLLTKFCWAYGYLTLILSAMTLPFFTDVLACFLKIMCDAITERNDNESNASSLIRVQVLTLSVTQFLRHALLLSCYMVPDCTELKLTPSSFLLIRDLLMRAWLLLNQCYLVVVPCVLWLLLIEWKLSTMT